MRVALVVIAPRRAAWHFASGSEATKYPLVDGPQHPGRHERLVVKPRGQQAADRLIDRTEIMPQRGPRVLGPHLHARFDASVRSPHIRLAVHLHETAGVTEVRRQQAARAVVLEAAGEDALPASGQSGNDRVPLVGGIAIPIPAKGELAASIDQLARLRCEPLGHAGRDGGWRAGACHGAPRSAGRGGRAAARISFVRVSRSTMK